MTDPCYTFTNWIVDGIPAGSAIPYTFTNVTTDHTITASYTQDTFNITASASVNGSISPFGVTNVGCGNNQTYSITPDGGYAVQDVLVDGVSVGITERGSSAGQPSRGDGDRAHGASDGVGGYPDRASGGTRGAGEGACCEHQG